MKRWLAVSLAVAVAAPARGAEPVELEVGQQAPFRGSLCDRECAARIAAKVEAANQMRDKCYEELKVKPSSAPSVAVVGVALLVGFLVGGAVVATVKK